MSGTRRKPGGLGPQVEGYEAWLVQRGYTPSTLRNMLKELGQVGRWLMSRRLRRSSLMSSGSLRSSLPGAQPGTAGSQALER